MADPISDLYQQLFGRINIRDGSVVEMAEHGRVGGVSTGAGFKRVVNIDPATGQAVGATVSVLGSIDANQAGLWYVNQSGPWTVNASVPSIGALDDIAEGVVFFDDFTAPDGTNLHTYNSLYHFPATGSNSTILYSDTFNAGPAVNLEAYNSDWVKTSTPEFVLNGDGTVSATTPDSSYFYNNFPTGNAEIKMDIKADLTASRNYYAFWLRATQTTFNDIAYLEIFNDGSARIFNQGAVSINLPVGTFVDQQFYSYRVTYIDDVVTVYIDNVQQAQYVSTLTINATGSFQIQAYLPTFKNLVYSEIGTIIDPVIVDNGVSTDSNFNLPDIILADLAISGDLKVNIAEVVLSLRVIGDPDSPSLSMQLHIKADDTWQVGYFDGTFHVLDSGAHNHNQLKNWKFSALGNDFTVTRADTIMSTFTDTHNPNVGIVDVSCGDTSNVFDNLLITTPLNNVQQKLHNLINQDYVIESKLDYLSNGLLQIASLPTLSVYQGGAWNVNATITGTVQVQQSGSWGVIVSNPMSTVITSLPTLSVVAGQTGDWFVNASIPSPVAAAQSGSWSVNATTFQGSPWNVTATIGNQLSVQSLPTLSVYQGGAWNINATIYGNLTALVSLPGEIEIKNDIGNPVPTLLTTLPSLTVLANQGGNWTVNASIPSPVSVTQGSTPWAVNGTVGVQQLGSWGVNATVFQGAPWNVFATATIANTLSVQSLPTLSVFQSGTWNVNATVYGNLSAVVSLPGEIEIKNDAGNPIPTYLTTLPSLTVLANQGGNWTVNASVPGPVPVTQSGAWGVTATIGNLLSIQSLPTLSVYQGGSWGITATIGNLLSIQSLPTLSTFQGGSWNVTATIGNIPAVSQSGAWNITATIGGLVTARAEDSPHTSADMGQFILGVRNDFASLATLTSANMDYSPFAVDDRGRMLVSQSIGILSNGVETTVTGTAIAVLNANVNRTAMIIQNTGAASARIGVAGVTATTGFRLASGEVVTFTNPFVPTATMTAIREGSTNTTIFTMEET